MADLYQASFIEREELLRRGKELELRNSALNAQRQALIDQREELAQQKRLRDRVEGFARRVQATIDRLDFAQQIPSSVKSLAMPSGSAELKAAPGG